MPVTINGESPALTLRPQHGLPHTTVSSQDIPGGEQALRTLGPLSGAPCPAAQPLPKDPASVSAQSFVQAAD